LFYNPVQGTMMTDPKTGKTETFVRTDPFTGVIVGGEGTKGDLQRAREEARADELLRDVAPTFKKKADVISSGWQSQYDKEEITYEEAVAGAQKEIDVLNIDYGKEQTRLGKKYPDVPNVFERRNTVRTAVETGTDLIVAGGALAVGAVNPVAGVAIGGAYFGGKGILQVTSRPTNEEIIAEGGLFAGFYKDKDTGKIMMEPTALDLKYKQERIKGGINLLVGASYGVGATTVISKSILTGELETLGQQPVKVLSVSKQGADSSFDIIKGVQRYGGLKRDITIAGKVIREGDKSFIMPVGEGTATTSGQFSWQLYKGYSPTYYAGADIFQVGTKGSLIAVGEKGTQLTVGRSVFIPKLSGGNIFKDVSSGVLDIALKKQKGRTISWFAGASEKVGTDPFGNEVSKIASGKLKTNVITGDGFKAGYLSAENFKPTTFGFQKVIKVPEPSATGGIDIGQGFKIFKDAPKYSGGVFKGGQNNILQTIITTDGTKQVSKVVQEGLLGDVASKLSPQISSVSYPSIVQAGGGGQSLYQFIGASQQVLDGGYSTMNRPQTTMQLNIRQNLDKTLSMTDLSVLSLSKTLKGTKSMMGVKSLALSQSMLGTQTLTQTKTMTKTQLKQGLKLKQQQRLLQQQMVQQPFFTTPRFNPSFNTGFKMGGFKPFFFNPPKSARFFDSRRFGQRRGQRTGYQTSFTGSALGIKGTGFAPGGLSVRGILNGKKTILNRSKKKKKARIL
jgi:hypothetical protein